MIREKGHRYHPTRLMYRCVFMQVYSQLPVEKLSGYSYDVEDSEPYPCYPLPVPDMVIDADLETAAPPTAPPAPAIVSDNLGARRETRSIYYGPGSQKNDVYSIFKVKHLFI